MFQPFNLPTSFVFFPIARRPGITWALNGGVALDTNQLRTVRALVIRGRRNFGVKLIFETDSDFGCLIRRMSGCRISDSVICGPPQALAADRESTDIRHPKSDIRHAGIRHLLLLATLGMVRPHRR